MNALPQPNSLERHKASLIHFLTTASEAEFISSSYCNLLKRMFFVATH